MSRLVSKAALATLALLFALNLAATRRAAAQDYYVSTSGSDSSGSGSQSSPWATISHAAGQVGPGAIVHVQAGTYSGSINTSTSGTSSSYITYEGDNSSWQPVNCAEIAANHGDLSQCPQLLGSWTNSGNYVKIQGFDVKGSGINAIYTQGNATIIAENHVHDTLNSTCNSTGGSGINLNGTNAQVIDNYVHNIGPYPSSCGFVEGIYFLQAGGFAYNNISFDNSGFGIQLWHYPSNMVLADNTVFNNASGGIVLGTDDSSFTVDYVTVEDNIVVNNGGTGISEQGCCSNSNGIHNIYQNNLVYGNSGGAYSLMNGLTATGTVNASPDFVNDTGDKTGDYHLQSSSPAIGAALSTSSPSTDFDGNARPQNGNYDIGSYEYVGSSTGTATLSISPTSAGFSSTTVGTTSPAQTLTLTNKSSSAVSLSGISISGANSADFAETNNCGSSVAASGNCSIDVTFAPQSSGTLTATLTVTPSSGSALQVALSGTGADAAAASVSPTSLSFPSTTVGQTSSAESTTLTNTGGSALTISGISVSGPFASSGTGTCGSSLSAGASCTIGVIFDPTTAGTESGTLSVTDNAGTQTVALTGTAQSVSTAPTKVTPAVSVSPASSQISAAQSLAVTVTVSGGTGNPTPTGTVTVGSGSYTSAATALTNGTATITIPAGSLSNGTDTLNAIYSPDATSSTIYNGATGTATVKVTGTKYLMSATSAHVNRGHSAKSTVTISSSTDYAGTISLACAITTSPAGATDLPTCSTTGTVTLNSSTTSGTAVVTVNSTSGTSASMAPNAPNGRGWAATGGAVLAFLLLPWIPRKRRKWLSLVVVAMAVTLFGGLVGCSAGVVPGSATASSGTTAGQYTITVTGTGNDAAKTQASTTFTLTVN